MTQLKEVKISELICRKKPYVGFDVPPGWFDLVLELDEKITEVDPDYVLIQAKEKFGGLRYYITGNDAAYLVVDEYENKSRKVCQCCGGSGIHRCIKHWYATICDNCFNGGE